MISLLDRARANGNPLIEGETVTLVWHGRRAPHLISDLHGWESNPQPLQKMGSDVWGITLRLPQDAYLEYAFYDPKTKKRLPDPFNQRSVNNGVGSRNHYFYMPGAGPHPLTLRPKGGLRGQVTRHSVPAAFYTASKTRRVDLYHPPTDAATPLLVVYDGPDYLQRGRLAVIVDNLIATGRIPPIAVAFVQNGGAARTVEYGCAEPTLGFITGPVMQLAAQELNLLDPAQHPGVHAVMGASMGGLMCVFTALRLPHLFGKVLSQAGAFAYGSEPGAPQSVVLSMLRHFPRPEVKIWLDCGRMDFLLEPVRAAAALLDERGYTYQYRENGGAHNYTTWRNACVAGLEYLFA